MSVEVYIKNCAETVGEGPHWDDSTNTFLHVDIGACKVRRYNIVTGIDEEVHLDDTVGFVVPAKKGGYVVGLGPTLSHLDWDTKKVTKLCEVEAGLGTHFNDGKCDARGRLFGGTVGFVPDNVAETVFNGSLYCMDLDNQVKFCSGKFGISNGLTWTKDNKTMFFIDSIPREIYAFDYNIDSGQVENRRLVRSFGDTPFDEMGLPDGMTIDQDGKIWVACYGSNKVIQFDPETGKELKSVKFPAKRVTSCCFGGKNFDELYVTSAKERVSDAELKQFPLSGSVFKVTGLGVKGYPATMYEGNITKN